jgi:phage recombination protein Bet
MSNTELATRPSELLQLTDEQIDLIKRTIAKDANDDELALFLYQAKRTGLDPLARQIHMVKRWNKKEKRNDMSIQVGIDGSRLIADRTGRYAGNDDPKFGALWEWKTENGEQYQAPVTASVTVWKAVGGQRCPFTATARWTEYYPGDRQGFMWRTKPYLMLGKCAEALALRKAFPAELSGIYTNEEMEQAGQDVTLEGEVAQGDNSAKDFSEDVTNLPSWLQELCLEWDEEFVLSAANALREARRPGSEPLTHVSQIRGANEEQQNLLRAHLENVEQASDDPATEPAEEEPSAEIESERSDEASAAAPAQQSLSEDEKPSIDALLFDVDTKEVLKEARRIAREVGEHYPSGQKDLADLGDQTLQKLWAHFKGQGE